MQATNNSRPTLLIWAMAVWAILQLGRFIAIPLIQDVLSGKDPPIWLFPAIGDIVIATPALLIAYLVWFRRGLWVWTLTLIWLALSIFDHTSTVVAMATTPPPHIFENFGSGGYKVPLGQAVIDAALWVWMAGKSAQRYFIDGL